MGLLASAKGIDFAVLKDMGARKLIVVVIAIIAIAAMAVTKVESGLLLKLAEWILYLVGIFVGGNTIEHLLKAKPNDKET